jgi:serine/threonine-protein kinase
VTARGTAPSPAPARRARFSWRAVPRRSLLYAIVAVSGFLIGYLIVALLVFPPDVVPNEAKVPSVVGLMFDDASRTLQASGFKVALGEERYNALAPKQTVLGQTPPAGSREGRGATITLDVSAGERQVSVPPVIGLTQQLAQTAIENAGLELGPISERESDSPRGAVLESLPAVGAAVAPSTRVALVVSSGPGLVQVPDVVGRESSEARLMIEQLGLTLGAMTIDSTTAGQLPNTVIAQSPAAGESVRAGTRVDVRITKPTP